MNCKVCGDPIFNKYAHRWFHTWTHDHWAVHPRNETKICSECGDTVHFNDNKWWHIHDNRNGKFCSIRGGFTSSEEKQIFKCIKCNQMMSYIEKNDGRGLVWHHDKSGQTHHAILENKKYIDEEQMRQQKCNEILLYLGHLKLNKSYDTNQINQYEEWLNWWINTSIENIIKEKGNYRLWCTSYGTPTEEYKFLEENKMINKDDNMINTDDKIKTQFTEDFDITKQYDDELSFIGKLTGRNNALYLRNKHQKLIDDAYNKIIDIKQIIENKDKIINQKNIDAIAAKNNIEKIKIQLEEYRVKYYIEPIKSLTDSMTETYKLSSEYDKNMFSDDIKTAQKLPTDFNIKNKIKGNFVDEINNDTNTQIPEQKFRNHYPYRTLDEGSKNIIDNDKNIQSLEIQKQKDYKIYSENKLKEYYEIMKEYKKLRIDFVYNCIEAKNRIKFYNKKLEEAKLSLSKCGYDNSIFFKFNSMKKQEMISIDTSKHIISNYEEQIDKMLNIYQNIEIDESHKDIEF